MAKGRPSAIIVSEMKKKSLEWQLTLQYLEEYWPCAGGLSAVNAIGTLLGDAMAYGGWR